MVVHSIAVSDVDGDRDMDVLAILNDDRKFDIVWYENTGGTDFGPQRSITTDGTFFGSLYSADIDGDSDVDVVWSNWDQFGWFENRDGKGDFSQLPKVVVNKCGATQLVHLADIDGDDDIDVVSADESCDKLVWYENSDGTGSFALAKEIGLVVDYVRAIEAIDVDNDGDLDVVSTTGDDGFLGTFGERIAWYENIDGNGNFSEGRLIDSTSGIYWSFASDIDGDGDMDIVVSHGPEPKGVSWYENLGNGNFSGQQFLLKASVAVPLSIPTVAAADIDGDGDMDILARPRDHIRLVWYENLSPQVAAGDANRDFQFDQQDIVQVLQAAKYLTAEPATFEEGDWNSDGVFDQLDVIAALQTRNYLQAPYASEAVDILMRERA